MNRPYNFSINEDALLENGNEISFLLNIIANKDDQFFNSLKYAFEGIFAEEELRIIFNDLEFRELLESVPILLYTHKIEYEIINSESTSEFYNLEGEKVIKSDYSRWESSTRAIYSLSNEYLRRYCKRNLEEVKGDTEDFKRSLVAAYIFPTVFELAYSLNDTIELYRPSVDKDNRGWNIFDLEDSMQFFLSSVIQMYSSIYKHTIQYQNIEEIKKGKSFPEPIYDFYTYIKVNYIEHLH